MMSSLSLSFFNPANTILVWGAEIRGESCKQAADLTHKHMAHTPGIYFLGLIRYSFNVF